MWIRDHFDPPDITGGSIRLLLSPARQERLPKEVSVPLATSANVGAAVVDWRRDVRSHSANIALLYVAGHGIQTTMEGGIVLLEDFANPNALTALTGAMDVQSVRRGIVSDPTQPGTWTPNRQFYFYNACRVRLPDSVRFDSLNAGITLDEPQGDAPDASLLSFGSRPRDYAFADARQRITLYSKAFLECLDTKAAVHSDGRTVRFTELQSALEDYVKKLSAEFGEDQRAHFGGGSITAPVHRRPVRMCMEGQFNPSQVVATRPVRFQVDPQLPVVARAGDVVIGETQVGEQRIQMPVGYGYEAVVPLPSGGEHVTRFEVPAGDGEVDVSIHVPPTELNAVPVVGRETEAEVRGAGEDYCVLRFLKWRGGEFEVDDLPRVISYERLATGDISLVVSIAHHAMSWPIDDYSFVLDVRTAPPLVQIDSTLGRSPLTVLPLAGGDAGSCEVIVHYRDSGVAVTARPRGLQATAVAGYLHTGRADRALTAMSVGAAELLRAKMADPIGAAIGGYALLKLNDLEQVRDWCYNLANWFPALPDGAVIAGAVAARRRQPEAAGDWFAAAADRGIPAFSEGLSLLVAETQNCGQVPYLAKIADLALMADFSALCTTLRTAPHDLEEGWLEVVPQAGAQVPRVRPYE